MALPAGACPSRGEDRNPSQPRPRLGGKHAADAPPRPWANPKQGPDVEQPAEVLPRSMGW
eukprot:11620757-Alexandrium_andersonii.AAC.1